MITVDIESIDLNHPNTMIVCTTQAEFVYMKSWLIMKGVSTHYLQGDDKIYPIAIGVLNGSWVDLMDRALFYVKFKDFINIITDDN